MSHPVAKCEEQLLRVVQQMSEASNYVTFQCPTISAAEQDALCLTPKETSMLHHRILKITPLVGIKREREEIMKNEENTEQVPELISTNPSIFQNSSTRVLSPRPLSDVERRVFLQSQAYNIAQIDVYRDKIHQSFQDLHDAVDALPRTPSGKTREEFTEMIKADIRALGGANRALRNDVVKLYNLALEKYSALKESTKYDGYQKD
eukprot:Tbor_TRINITY_DN8501_c0_g1::TRINITY_DN8501_c0_g1_i1::g.18141::m.18141